MAQRLTTYEDLEKYPELRSKGVSLNQLFDYDAYDQLIGNQNEEDEVKDELPFTKNSNRKKAPAKKTAKKK